MDPFKKACNMETLLMLFIFVTVLLMFYSFYLVVFEQRVTIKNRLKQTGNRWRNSTESRREKQKNSSNNLLRNMIRLSEKSTTTRGQEQIIASLKPKPIEFIEISIMAVCLYDTVDIVGKDLRGVDRIRVGSTFLKCCWKRSGRNV